PLVYVTLGEIDNYQNGFVIISGFADPQRAFVDEFSGDCVEGVDLNLGMTAVPYVFKQRDFRHDHTPDRNGKRVRTNERLPLVHRENRGKDFQPQLRLLGIISSQYLFSLYPNPEKLLREILVWGNTIEIDGNYFPLELLSI